MPLSGFSPVIRPNQSLEDYQTPFSDYVTAKLMQSFDSNPTTMLLDKARMMDKLPRDPMMWDVDEQPLPHIDSESAAQIASQAGVHLKISDEGIGQDALDLLIERKTNEKVRADAISRSPTGMRSVAGGAASLAAGALDPLFLGASVIPFVGPTRYALALSQTTNAVSRAGVRAAAGAVQGAAGMATIEPAIYGLHQSLQDDYSALDSIMNIGFGGVLGGGLHVLGGAVKDMVLGYKPDEMSRLLKTYKEEQAKAPVIAEDTPITPEVIESVVARNEEKAVYDAVETHQPQAAGYWEGPQGEFTPTTEVPTFGERAKELAFNDRRWYASPDIPARAAVAAADPMQREAALKTAVGQSLEGKIPEVEPIFDAAIDTQAAAEHAHSPDNVRVADKEASVKADEVVQTEPKGTALADAERALSESEQQMIDRWAATGRLPEDLNKAIEKHTAAVGKQADELSAVAKAAVSKGCI